MSLIFLFHFLFFFHLLVPLPVASVFFLNDTPTPEIYPLPLPAALPICLDRIHAGRCGTIQEHHRELLAAIAERPATVAHPPQPRGHQAQHIVPGVVAVGVVERFEVDRKSTRLNSSHSQISYAVFCLKKKKKNDQKYVITISITSTSAIEVT